MVLRALALSLAAMPAHAEVYSFCWPGSGGYAVTGTMEVPDIGLVTQDDVTAFTITGWHDGVRIGSWDLAELTPTTSWVLSFDTRTMSFPMGGGYGAYQAWNAGGGADDCGTPGFGFNAGNNAQDICLDDTWITESMVDRNRPLLAVQGREVPDCFAVPLLG